MRIEKVICLSILLLATTVARAQFTATMYHMKDLPQNHQLNPAFQPRNGSVFVGLPGLNAFPTLSLMLQGEGLTVGNAYLSPNFKKIVEGDGLMASGALGLDMNLINFGFMFKDMYFSFDSKLKLNFEGRIPKGLMELVWYGNGDDKTLGRSLSFEGLGISGIAYAEVALGFSKEILKNELVVGGKVKYLQGLMNINVGLGEGSHMATDRENYNISVGIKPDIFLAGLPVAVPEGAATSLDSMMKSGIGSYIFNTGNNGFAFDFGGSWDLKEVKGLNVSASVLNIGFISWKGSEIKAANDNDITFGGFEMGKGSDFGTALMDSIKQSLAVTSTVKQVRKWLYPTIYAGVNYELWKYLNVGGLFGYQLGEYESTPLYSVSLNTQSFMVNLSASYSYYNRNNNVGFGIVVGRKYVQWHVILDNLLAVNFQTAQNVNLRMGFNMLFGSGKAKRNEQADTMSPSFAPLDSVAALNGVQGDSTLAVRPDTTAGAVQQPDSTLLTPRQLTKEELLKKALEEENMEGKKKASAKKVSKEELLRRALEEEKQEGEKASTKKTAAKKSETSREALLKKAREEERKEK
jgi:hypothetical protein